MDRFLLFPDDRRRALCDEAGRLLRLTTGSVEKDFWVCWTLRTLFALPATGPHLTFKGGTSLSKGWNLIKRFSEDVDVVIDRDFLGFGGSRSPENASSQNQRQRRLDELKAECQRHIREVLGPAFDASIRDTLPDVSAWRLEIDPDDTDEQTLLFSYPSVVAEAGYVRPVVRIELGARSDIDPTAQPEIRPYIADISW